MSEPVYVVDCFYCKAIIPVFRDGNTIQCKACGGIMRLVYPNDVGYSDAKMELEMLRKVKMKE
jgi:hypothetical protein